jgi:predicted nucleic acid-binding Zn ribbon protein
VPFVSIKETLSKVLKGYDRSGDMEAYRVYPMWEELVGQKMAQHATPVRIKDRVLFVEVDDPLWLSQLKYMKGDVLGKIDVRIKRGVLKDVKFYLKSAY